MTLAQAVYDYARQYHEEQIELQRVPNHYTKRIFSINLSGERAFGLLFNLTSVWIGVHYSKRDRRFCMNIIPCCTIWWTKTRGEKP